jgi:hypothetical protein
VVLFTVTATCALAATALLESARGAPADDVLEALADRMLGRRPPIGDDDVTLLLVRVHGPAEPELGAERATVA